MPLDRDATLKQAEKLLRQGRLEGAIAEYVRLVDDQPRDWNAVSALGDLYARAGQADRAVEQFVRVADDLMAQGFLPRAAAHYKKVLRVRPDHEHTHLRLADLSARMGLVGDAKYHLMQVAERRRLRRDARGATEMLIRLGLVDPDDADAKVAAARAAREIGEVTTAASLLRQAADVYEKRGRSKDALEVFAEALEIDPATSGDDPRMLLLLASRELQSGRLEEGRAALTRLLSVWSDRRSEAMAVGCELAEHGKIDAAFVCLELVADVALLDQDWPGAAAALKALADRSPHHVAALRRLVEVCVDGGLDALMIPTQERLADAYLATGHAREARVVAEDLVARQPDEGNRARLQRALALLGESDPGAAIAATFRTEEPFEVIEEPVTTAPAPPRPGIDPSMDADDEPFVLEAVEIDLSDALTGIGVVAPPEEAAPPPDLEHVFEDLRAKLGAEAEGRHQYDAGTAHLRANRVAEAIMAFEAAARVPTVRFEAAAQLGRIYLRGGDLGRGVDWLERAAEAPAPTVEDGHAVLFDLADALEAAGEPARALAILIELAADAPGYRDVAARIDRLSRARTGS